MVTVRMPHLTPGTPAEHRRVLAQTEPQFERPLVRVESQTGRVLADRIDELLGGGKANSAV